MPFEVDYSGGRIRLLQHVTCSCSLPLAPDYTVRKKQASAVWNTCQQPPTATLIFTTMQIEVVIVPLLESRGEHFNEEGLAASPGNTVFAHTLVLLMLAFDSERR